MAKALRIQYPDAYYHVRAAAVVVRLFLLPPAAVLLFWMDWQIALKPMLLSSSAKLKRLSHG